MLINIYYILSKFELLNEKRGLTSLKFMFIYLKMIQSQQA